MALHGSAWKRAWAWKRMASGERQRERERERVLGRDTEYQDEGRREGEAGRGRGRGRESESEKNENQEEKIEKRHRTKSPELQSYRAGRRLFSCSIQIMYISTNIHTPYLQPSNPLPFQSQIASYFLSFFYSFILS